MWRDQIRKNIYEKFNLNREAGLGRRLALAGVVPDADLKDSSVFIVSAKFGVVEALNLATTLSFQAKRLNLDLHFEAERIAGC